jgi:hypothetical protein
MFGSAVGTEPERPPSEESGTFAPDAALGYSAYRPKTVKKETGG